MRTSNQFGYWRMARGLRQSDNGTAHGSDEPYDSCQLWGSTSIVSIERVGCTCPTGHEAARKHPETGNKYCNCK